MLSYEHRRCFMYKKSTQDELKTRRTTILNLLAENKSRMLTTDIADYLGVSEMTVRRDLQTLEQTNLVTRFHGGVRLNELPNHKNTAHCDIYLEGLKTSLAQRAATYIPSGSTIFLNSSSTAASVLSYVCQDNLTLISNNLRLATMNLHSGITVILTGGEIRSHKEALVGDIALRALEKVQANIAIMGCSGISAQHGISTNNIHEANVNARMIQNAHDLVIVVADHRKVGNDTNFNVTDLSHVDILITDTYANTQSIREIEELGVQVLQVSSD